MFHSRYFFLKTFAPNSSWPDLESLSCDPHRSKSMPQRHNRYPNALDHKPVTILRPCRASSTKRRGEAHLSLRAIGSLTVPGVNWGIMSDFLLLTGQGHVCLATLAVRSWLANNTPEVNGRPQDWAGTNQKRLCRRAKLEPPQCAFEFLKTLH